MLVLAEVVLVASAAATRPVLRVDVVRGRVGSGFASGGGGSVGWALAALCGVVCLTCRVWVTLGTGVCVTTGGVTGAEATVWVAVRW